MVIVVPLLDGMLGATQFLHIPGLELSCPLDALQVWNPVDLLPV
ncbi:hypothetical protein NC651_020623 [Populus alba x Populus x berolinensis]|nr:hypothetical protein NC651_020623 [Populus alba x Populus x berolinensis]